MPRGPDVRDVPCRVVSSDRARRDGGVHSGRRSLAFDRGAGRRTDRVIDVTTVLNGLLGGLVAGAVAVVALRIAAGPQSLLASVRGDTSDLGTVDRVVGVLAELVYAAVVGGLFVALERYVLDTLAVPPRGDRVLWLTLGWAVALFLVGTVVWRLGGDRSLLRGPYRDLLSFHLTYALVLAAWIRLTWIA